MTTLKRCSTWLTLLIGLAAGAAAFAQEPATRAEADKQRREEKSRNVAPYKPGGFERAMHFAEEKAIFILGREGLYPKLGSLTTGSGFAYGAGFRDRDLFDKKGTVDVWAATSTRRYWATEARLTFPNLAHKRVLVETWAAHRDYPEEQFFGIGPDSARDSQTSYAIQSDLFGGRIGVRPHPIVLVGGGLEYLNPRLGQGKDSRVPSIEDVFDESSAPGLGESVDYLRSMGFLEIDYREPVNARKGGWYRVDLSRLDDRTSGRFTFNRLDTDLRQFIGFLAGRRVIATRLFVSTSETEAGQAMPFYLMPTLGGADVHGESSLRSYRDYRFRAPDTLFGQFEYGRTVYDPIGMFAFYDVGSVAAQFGDVARDVKHSVGVGLTFRLGGLVFGQIYYAWGGNEGTRFNLSGNSNPINIDRAVRSAF